MEGPEETIIELQEITLEKVEHEEVQEKPTEGNPN